MTILISPKKFITPTITKKRKYNSNNKVKRFSFGGKGLGDNQLLFAFRGQQEIEEGLG